MAKNILLLFLSPVRFISGKPVESHYEALGDEKTQTTNESAFRHLLKKKIVPDKIFILASKKVREPIAGRSQTHLDFFIARLEKFLPNVDCSVYNYNENDGGDETLKSVAEMARLIQNFSADDDVTLHLDLTGGMRHVNMIMLELTRLLQYSGLKVGNVLYSNYNNETKTGSVEEIQNVYDLFQLIAGVEEFVNFGSVNALEIYYAGKKISEPLKKLFAAMKNFSRAIKLCHYGQFRKAIEDLHDNLRYFEKNFSAEDVQDVLMARFIGRIREDYHDLIVNRKSDDAEIIRWCVKHDYLQQALTLYTERIPEYLGEKNFLVLTDESEKNLTAAVTNDEMGRNKFFFLFSEVKPKETLLDDALRKFRSALKAKAWPDIRKKNFDFDKWATKLNDALAKQNLSLKNDARLRLQLKTFAKIFRDPKLLLDLHSPELEPLDKLFAEISAPLEQVKYGVERQKIIIKFMTEARVEKLSEIFDGVDFVRLVSKYPRAQKIFELLLEKIFVLNIPEENFLSIVDKYFVIKNERNHTNHAHEKFGEFTTDTLRVFMFEALDELKAFTRTESLSPKIS